MYLRTIYWTCRHHSRRCPSTDRANTDWKVRLIFLASFFWLSMIYGLDDVIQNGRRDPVVSRGTSGFRVLLEQFALVCHVYLENRPCSPCDFNHWSGRWPPPKIGEAPNSGRSERDSLKSGWSLKFEGSLKSGGYQTVSLKFEWWTNQLA